MNPCSSMNKSAIFHAVAAVGDRKVKSWRSLSSLRVSVHQPEERGRPHCERSPPVEKPFAIRFWQRLYNSQIKLDCLVQFRTHGIKRFSLHRQVIVEAERLPSPFAALCVAEDYFCS